MYFVHTPGLKVVCPATAYDVARGALSMLGTGSFTSACAANDLPDSPYAETEAACAPTAGDGCWYLVRGQNECATGSYGPSVLDGASPCP